MFTLQEKMHSQNGKSWVDKVFSCLQKKIWTYSEKNPSCEIIKSNAFKSHPDCYISAGFCELAVGEKLQIFNLIKKEILDQSAWSQGAQVLKSCKEH